MKNPLLICVLSVMLGCTNRPNEMETLFLVERVPEGLPMHYAPTDIQPGYIIHRGIFSNDLSEFYFTISDTSFSNFTVQVTSKIQGKWTKPKEAFFNSKYDDHGMSFSPDGNTLVFSSTRPTPSDKVPQTWHIWRSEQDEEGWSTPVYVEIPNLRSKLISHPTLGPNGTIYFQASNLDYSELSIYYSRLSNGKYQDAEKIPFDLNAYGYCTPYLSADGNHLVFAAVNEHLDLYICDKLKNDQWSTPRKLSDEINRHGQGNPYLTPGGDFLFYAIEDKKTGQWRINWISTASFL